MPDSYAFNLDTKQWVKSFDNPEPIATSFPEMSYGDNRLAHITFLRESGNGVAIEQSLVSAQLGIAATVGGTVLSSSTAGTVSAAFAYPFTINLTDSAVATAIGTNNPLVAYLEFLLTDATGPQRYLARIKLFKQVLSGAVADPPAPEIPLTVNTGHGLFVPKEWPAGMVQVVTTASGRRFLNYPGDDGQWHLDPI